MAPREPNEKPSVEWRERWWSATTLVWFAMTGAAKDLCGPRVVASIAGGLLVSVIVAGLFLHRKGR